MLLVSTLMGKSRLLAYILRSVLVFYTHRYTRVRESKSLNHGAHKNSYLFEPFCRQYTGIVSRHNNDNPVHYNVLKDQYLN